jgi:hypothetical protein
MGVAVKFKQEYGSSTWDEMKQWPVQTSYLKVDEQVVQMQLQFLRTCTCVMLVCQALD